VRPPRLFKLPTDALKDSHCAIARRPGSFEVQVNITSIPIVSTAADPYPQCARTHHTVVAVSAATPQPTVWVLLCGGPFGSPALRSPSTNLSSIRVEDQ
jgi:hypothetical protein